MNAFRPTSKRSSPTILLRGTHIQIRTRVFALKALVWHSLQIYRNGYQPSRPTPNVSSGSIAGSGKSTLSATIVDNLRKNHTPIAAQFFISRNIPNMIEAEKIIPTIVHRWCRYLLKRVEPILLRKRLRSPFRPLPEDPCMNFHIHLYKARNVRKLP
jgi:hypothetical protein